MVIWRHWCWPALLAALEPAILGKVQFILAVGGYHDLVEVLTFFNIHNGVKLNRQDIETVVCEAFDDGWGRSGDPDGTLH